ncbi:hypothetical protein GJ496_007620 [Pomphorhynchus laevis]|nr:hypothetical protein GJ496_007620 [Pomphorhynchus laevis]
MVAVGLSWKEHYVNSAEEYSNMKKTRELLFEQLPSLKIDNMILVQTDSIVRYIARKYNMLEGKSIKESVLIDMLYSAARDFYFVFMLYKFKDEEETLKEARTIACPRYMPVFEDILRKSTNKYQLIDTYFKLVEDRLSIADIGLLEVLLSVKDYVPEQLNMYPLLNKYLERMSNSKPFKAYLNSNSRHSIVTQQYVDKVYSVLDGDEIVKPCLKIFAKYLGNKNIEEKVEEFTLSKQTITRRIEGMSQDVYHQLKDLIK